MSTLTWDHYCGSGGGAGREWSSCWSRPGPSRALPKNSGVRTYVRTHAPHHYSTSSRSFGRIRPWGWYTPAASHLGRWWCQLRRRRVSKVLELSSIPKDIQGVCDRNASFLFAIFKTQLIIYATCCLLPACLSECRNVGRCLYENRFLTGKWSTCFGSG